MKIALCGPASLHLVKGLLRDSTDLPEGYAYPLAAYLAKIFHARGHEVSIVSNVHGAAPGSRWSGQRFEIRLDPRRRLKEFVLDAYRQERKSTVAALYDLEPDIVHGQWVYDYAHAVTDTEFPHLVTIRDYPWAIAKHTRSPYRVYRALYAHHVVPKIQNLSAISNYVAEPFNRVYRYKKPIRLIPNGLSSELFSSADCVERRGACRTIASVSGWDPRKNVKALLRAFNQLRKAHPDSCLLLIGSGLGRGEAGHLWAEAHGLTSGVEFVGKMSHADMLQVLRERSDMFVHSTLEESFCMTVLEAMAQGLPVVAFPDSGAIPWLLNYGEAGKLASSQKWQDLAEAMLQVFEDTECRFELAVAGYQRAKEEFTLEAVADQYLQAYQDVLDGQYNSVAAPSRAPE